MERRYIEKCSQYGCKAKVFNQMKGELKKKIGTPDLVIIFVNSVSHKMARCAATEAKRCNASLEHCHDSLNALSDILETYVERAEHTDD